MLPLNRAGSCTVAACFPPLKEKASTKYVCRQESPTGAEATRRPTPSITASGPSYGVDGDHICTDSWIKGCHFPKNHFPAKLSAAAVIKLAARVKLFPIWNKAKAAAYAFGIHPLCFKELLLIALFPTPPFLLSPYLRLKWERCTDGA